MTPLWLLVVLALGQDAAPGATESYRGRIIREVRLEHPGGPPPEASRELIELSPGEPYRPEAVRRSIQQLFSLGVFSDIKVEASPAGDNGREVEVLFRLFPRLEVTGVELEGLEAESGVEDLRSRLLEECELEAGDPLEVDELGAAAERLSVLLRSEGYLWARVEPEASFQSPAAVVVFHVDPGVRARVGTLTIEGVPAHIEAHVRRELALSAGAPYSRAELDRKIQSLAADWQELGYYGAQVSVVETPVENERVDVRLTPAMGPRVRIEVEGWDFSDKELSKLVPLFSEARFTEDLVEESRVNLEEDLKDQGHRDAAVSVEREILGDEEHLVLHFRVAPGPKFEVDARSKSRDSGRLRMRKCGPFSSLHRGGECARPHSARRPGTPISRRCAPISRARVSIGRGSIAWSGWIPKPRGWLTLVLRVEEGPRALVDRVELQGAAALEPSAVLEAARMEPADPFAASEVVAARERIHTLYRNEGFRAAEVEARGVLDEPGESALVTFVVREGERTRVDRVILAGLRVTKETAARRLVTIEPGAPLSPMAIAETRQNLVGSGLFRSVDIEPLPPDPETLRSDVLITLSEGPRTTFAYGFGYEEQQLARAEIEVTRRNLFGRNRSVSLFTRAKLSRRQVHHHLSPAGHLRLPGARVRELLRRGRGPGELRLQPRRGRSPALEEGEPRIRTCFSGTASTRRKSFSSRWTSTRSTGGSAIPGSRPFRWPRLPTAATIR